MLENFHSLTADPHFSPLFSLLFKRFPLFLCARTHIEFDLCYFQKAAKSERNLKLMMMVGPAHPSLSHTHTHAHTLTAEWTVRVMNGAEMCSRDVEVPGQACLPSTTTLIFSFLFYAPLWKQGTVLCVTTRQDSTGRPITCVGWLIKISWLANCQLWKLLTHFYFLLRKSEMRLLRCSSSILFD